MSTLYDDDILVWSERQAAILRDLPRTQRDLPNDFDVENVAEEIESVGRDQLQSVASYLRLVLSHAIKVASVDDPDLVAGWLDEMIRFHVDAVSRLSPSMPNRIDMDRIWRLALKEARSALSKHGQTAIPLPEACPVPVGLLLSEDFDPDHAIAVVLAASPNSSGSAG